MTEREKKQFAKQLLALLKKASPNSVSNKRLREQLTLETDQFFEVRDYLIDQNQVAKAMGQGGASVFIPQATVPEEIQEEKKLKGKERQLYDPLIKTLNDEWAPDNGIKTPYIVCKTAEMGKKDTGGKWSRPDITIITKKTWGYLQVKQMEVITFEVKPLDCLDDITGVYETASHAMFAHYSYLLLQYNNGTEKAKIQVENVSNLCKRFGIGLILFSDPKDINTFIPILEPNKKSPEYNDIEFFLMRLHKEDIKIIKDW
jgi:hypothetical protein